jgi:hypothetical protein
MCTICFVQLVHTAQAQDKIFHVINHMHLIKKLETCF